MLDEWNEDEEHVGFLFLVAWAAGLVFFGFRGIGEYAQREKRSIASSLVVLAIHLVEKIACSKYLLTSEVLSEYALA